MFIISWEQTDYETKQNKREDIRQNVANKENEF